LDRVLHFMPEPSNHNMRVPVGIRRFKRKSTHPRRLPFPASPDVRAAQVTPTTFFEDIKAFSHERWRELEDYRPRILVGPATELRRLAEQVELGNLDVRSVDRAVFVLTACGGTPVSDVARVVLWQTFGVPVYELLVGAKDILLACECELQEGWHPQPYATFSLHENELLVHAFRQPAHGTGLLGKIESAACPCGRPGMRLTDIEALGPRELPRELAATA
jgi:hypothetical protein